MSSFKKIFGKCSSLEHVFLPDGFKKFVSAILGKKTDKRGPLKGVTYVPSLNFKTCHFTYKRGCYVTVGILLMYFSVVVTVSTHLCVVCLPFLLSYVTVSRLCRLLKFLHQQGLTIKYLKCPSFLCNYLLYPGCHHFCNFF